MSHLSASLASRLGKSLLYTDKVITKDNKEINLNIQHAIILKSAQSNEELLYVIRQSRTQRLEVEEFTREMIDTSNDKLVLSLSLEKNFDDIERLGVLIFGPKEIVEEITKKFTLIK